MAKPAWLISQEAVNALQKTHSKADQAKVTLIDWMSAAGLPTADVDSITVRQLGEIAEAMLALRLAKIDHQLLVAEHFK